MPSCEHIFLPIGRIRDRAAFHAYVDRMAKRTPIAIIEPEEWSEDRMPQILDEIERRKQK